MPEKPTTKEQMDIAREATMLEDARRVLKFDNDLARAGQEALGMKLEGGSDDGMIIGDVTINNTDSLKRTSGIGKWAGVALAGLGLGGGLGVPAALYVADKIFTSDKVEPAEPDYYGIGVFRPEECETAIPLKSDGITVISASWCGPCRTYKEQVLKPLIQEGYKIKIVMNDNPGHAVPMTYFFDKGRVIDKQSGIISRSTLKKVLTK